jgi:glycerophosphoryl diester phosphodiesterase
MGLAPENTIAAVKEALKLGTPCIEIDVYYIDKHLVVFHDDRLERTTNGSGYLDSLTFEQLRSLDAGNGQVIPTLAEVIETVNQRAAINIELKGPHTAQPVVEMIGALCDKRGWPKEHFLISSFNQRELAQVRQLDAHLKIGALLMGLPLDNAAFASGLDAYSVHPALEFIDREFMKDARSRNLRVFVYTVNYVEDIARMENLGVDGVFTDFPDRVMRRQSMKHGPIGWM